MEGDTNRMKMVFETIHVQLLPPSDYGCTLANGLFRAVVERQVEQCGDVLIRRAFGEFAQFAFAALSSGGVGERHSMQSVLQQRAHGGHGRRRDDGLTQR